MLEINVTQVVASRAMLPALRPPLSQNESGIDLQRRFARLTLITGLAIRWP